MYVILQAQQIYKHIVSIWWPYIFLFICIPVIVLEASRALSCKQTRLYKELQNQLFVMKLF